MSTEPPTPHRIRDALVGAPWLLIFSVVAFFITIALGFYTADRDRGTPETIGPLARAHHQRIERELAARGEAHVWGYALRLRGDEVVWEERWWRRKIGSALFFLMFGTAALFVIFGQRSLRPNDSWPARGLFAVIVLATLLICTHLLTERVVWRWELRARQATRTHMSWVQLPNTSADRLDMRGAVLRPALEVVEDYENGTTLYGAGWWINATHTPPVRGRLWREGTWWPMITGPRDARAEGLALCWVLAARLGLPCQGGDADHVPREAPQEAPQTKTPAGGAR